MKLNRQRLRKMILETWYASGAGENLPGGSDDPALAADHAALQPGREVYALISIPYEGSIVLSDSSIEALREEIESYTGAGMATLEAIFYADIIEGEL